MHNYEVGVHDWISFQQPPANSCPAPTASSTFQASKSHPPGHYQKESLSTAVNINKSKLPLK